MVSESWFRNLWRRNGGNDRSSPLIGVLTFEVANLMGKLSHMWNCLSDKHVAVLRQEIMKSYGIRNLISEDDDYIAGLICGEMVDNLNLFAKVLVRLADKCEDVNLRSFGNAYGELVKTGITDLYGWQLSFKEMEKKVKKMQRFVDVNTSLLRELRVLSQLEYNARRLKGSECEKKLLVNKREVNQLKMISLWNKSYDYVLLLLARCLFTVYRRIQHVFGTIHDTKDIGSQIDFDFIERSQSVSAMMQSSIHPTEKNGSVEGRVAKKTEFYSGPLGRTPTIRSNLNASMKKKTPVFFSGPIEKITVTSNLMPNKSGFKIWPFKGKSSHSKQSNNDSVGHNLHRISQVSKSPPPGTLGAAALASHYANIIITIEKLSDSPHLIGEDTRVELYTMLPSSIRAILRKKLKPHAKSLACDTALGQVWSDSMSDTLEWLAPLAHNMIRWQSARSFEHQDLDLEANVFLVQTLHFANQEKTDNTITELLIGLNYIWRLGQDLNNDLMKDQRISNGMLHNSLNLEGL